MENPIELDDLGGKSTIFGNTHMYHNMNFLWVVCVTVSSQKFMGTKVKLPEVEANQMGVNYTQMLNVWRIYLHLAIFMVNVGKYTIH